MKPNPKWQVAEDARQKAEANYAAYMKKRHKDHDDDHAEIQKLNAAIEAANQKVRATPEHL